jgi:DtxR family Mn-dependent transcriptional regulator
MGGYPTAVEDYVKAVYAHTEWQPEPITTSALAVRLGLAASSVTEMVKKLTSQGLVDHEPYGAVTLTTDGTALALRMLRRHRLIETWLVEHFGYTWDEVHDEAEVLEHALSDRMLDRIDADLGRPRRDPHGDPIPDHDGTVERPHASLLRDVLPGETVRVVRISDRDPDVLRLLEAGAIAIDGELTVVTGDPFAVLVESSAAVLGLEPDAVGSIWVSRAGHGRVK